MTVLPTVTPNENVWVKRFAPESRVITGPLYVYLKRGMDIILVTLASPVWVSILCGIALLIWVSSPGAPVLFSQLRTGKGGRRFYMYKFRTMVPDAEELKSKYAHLNELKSPDFKITNDPRVTFVGRLLRKTSMDELPQLLNVLRGEMSLVGPRPTSFGAETYKLWHTERLEAIPGITGLWQIEGRGRLEFDQRLRLDISYIERACLWLDIAILFRTITAVFKQRGAH